MSKRVSNKKGKHKGFRCKRIKIGYHRKRKIMMLQRQRQLLMKAIEENTTDKSKEAEEQTVKLQDRLVNVGKTLNRFIPRPKNFVRRRT